MNGSGGRARGTAASVPQREQREWLLTSCIQCSTFVGIVLESRDNCEYAGQHGTPYEVWHTGLRNSGLRVDESRGCSLSSRRAQPCRDLLSGCSDRLL